MEKNIHNAKILIVEDEVQINRLIELVLQSDGFYKILKAFDGKEALNIIQNDKPDLILLDVMLPEIDGFSLCKLIKRDKNYNSVKIIMLTAKNLEIDILKGFELGAIDYITKPFSNKILLARVNSHLQNSDFSNNEKTYKDIILDEKCKTVKIKNEKIELTKFEFVILQIFISNVGVVFSRSQLLNFLRGDDGFDISERAIDVQIVNLRRKLGDSGSCIETVRGMGYKLKEV